MKRNVLIILVVGIVIGVGLLLVGMRIQPDTVPAPVQPTAEVPEGTHVITLTKDGFSPAELQITQGETVTFVSTAGELFWPASNLHPSHTVYPEFDPQMPISPTESWSFTFTKVGEWKFHDHLAPYFTGVITVTP